MEQGTGKTLVAIANIGVRHLRGEVYRVIIFTTKSTLYSWEAQVKRLLNVQKNVVVLDGKGETRIAKLRQARGTDLQVVITNYNTVLIMEDEIKRWNPDMVIVDESHHIKSSKSRQSRAIHRIGKKAGVRMIMTGTVMTKNPLDVFGQYRFLDPDIFGTNFGKFRSQYAVMGGYMGYQIKGWRNLKALHRRMYKVAFRATKEECLDLPDEVDEVLYGTLDPESRAIYDEMEREAIVSFQESEAVATIALTKLLRLSQITGGFLGTEDGPVALSGAKCRLLMDILMDTLSDERKKVVIFARFLPEIQMISDQLEGMKIEHRIVTGKVSAEERHQAVEQFQTIPQVRVFLAQIATGGEGIELFAADTAIFYSTDYSYGNYEQARARLHRPGQVNKVTYYNLIMKNTIDEVVYDAIKNKEDLITKVVDHYRTQKVPTTLL